MPHPAGGVLRNDTCTAFCHKSKFELLTESGTQAYMLLPFFPQVQELRRVAQPCVSFLALEFRRVYRAVFGGPFESCGGASCHVHMHMLVLHAM